MTKVWFKLHVKEYLLAPQHWVILSYFQTPGLGESLRIHTISSLNFHPTSEGKAPKQEGWKAFPAMPGPSVSQDILWQAPISQFRNNLRLYHPIHYSSVQWPVKSMEILVDGSEPKSSAYSKGSLATLILK